MVESDERARRCPVCGGDSRDCQDSANQAAYHVEWSRCYVTRAHSIAMRARESDPQAGALVPHITLDPSRVRTH